MTMSIRVFDVLALIGLSPVLTHQHHVIDIVGGFVLAGFCFVAVRPKICLASGNETNP